MTAGADAWRAGHRVLVERVRALPRLLRDGMPRLQAFPADWRGRRRVVVTGVGSSAAHARFLAHLLAERGAFDVQVVPLSAFLAPRVPSEEILVVFSQGLSPNARIALADPGAWARVIVVTAATEGGARAAGEAKKADVLAALRAAGVAMCPLPAGEDEYTTLVRVIGPMAGYVAALHLARAGAAPAPPVGAAGRVSGMDRDVDTICDALAAAPAAAERVLAGFDPRFLARGIAFVTTGTYGELVENLRYKVLEGMLLPAPPVWDSLHVAHGPLQQAHAGSVTVLALTRRDAPAERDLLARIERALDPERHRLLRLEATLPGALAIFEHEALVNEIMLRYIAAAGIDQMRWPGQGREGELYGLDAAPAPETAPAPDVAASAAAASDAGATPDAISTSAGRRGDVAAAAAGAAVPPGVAGRRLDTLTWPELEALLARGVRTAVVPLGATEQHGPHLPFATDTWIAEALAERVCARVPDSIQCPVLALGCSAEHLDFPGTLDVEAETLERVLRDVLLSLRHHGFDSAFVFSAHGGNFAPLRAASGRLRAVSAPMRLAVHDDLEGVTSLWHRLSADAGVSAAASGHHAGEFETSILAALRPDTVRVARVAPGILAPPGDAQALFYPSLRRHAPTGVVGDPRAAAPERAARYLDAWANLLVAAFRRANPSA
jgi:creatinine amidohydrolase